jgi:hypothetical protein
LFLACVYQLQANKYYLRQAFIIIQISLAVKLKSSIVFQIKVPSCYCVKNRLYYFNNTRGG